MRVWLFGERVPTWLLLTAAACIILAGVLGAAAQQPGQQGPTVEQRIGYEIGPMIVRAAVLSAQLEEARAIIAQRDKSIADLQAQLAEAKKEPPK